MKHRADSTARCQAVRTILAFAEELAVPPKLRKALEIDREFKLLCISSRRIEVVRRAAESQPDLMLFWFRTSADLSILKELRRAAPDSAVVLCVEQDLPPETERESVALGVRALLSTTAGFETFKECLRLSIMEKKAAPADPSAPPPRSFVVSCSSKAR
jgi:DNA-binding NarL/FixJ family response regulator